MPKYIDKQKLPQFRFFNICDDDNGWETSKITRNGKTEEISRAWIKADNSDSELRIDYYAEIETDILYELNNDINELNSSDTTDHRLEQLYEKWISAKTPNAIKINSYIGVLIRAMVKDAFYAQKWIEKIVDPAPYIKELPYEPLKKTLTLTMHIDGVIQMMQFSRLLKACHGFPISATEQNVLYPKMLLIKDEFYKTAKDTANFSFDFEFIRQSLGQEIYIINISGESAEKNMTFTISSEEYGVCIRMLDPRNGPSSFLIKRIKDTKINKENNLLLSNCSDDDVCITTQSILCHPRGDYYCNESERPHQCIYCNGTHNCKHKSMNIAAAVLYCFQEFQKKEHFKRVTHATSGNQSKESSAPVFVPDDMIKLYEIKLSKEEKLAIKKYGQSAYPSTEKAPHVRRSTMRFNPKTGEKDIFVRGCVVHKDKYTGFSSAYRINE